MDFVVLPAIVHAPRGLLEEDDIADADRLGPHELQPAGLVAAFGGVDGPDSLLQRVISKAPVLDRDQAVGSPSREVLPSYDVLRVGRDGRLRGDVRVRPGRSTS